MKEIIKDKRQSEVRRSRTSRDSFGSGGRKSESRGSENLRNSRPSLQILIPADEPGTESNPNFATPNNAEVSDDENEKPVASFGK